jgi:RimJ/RimL family protein N-acetyltransferase
LKDWKPRPAPERRVLDGRYVRLEPLDAQRHGDGLFAASAVIDADSRFRWLMEYPPTSRDAFTPWLDKSQASQDPLFFAVIDKLSGKIAGRQALMRIDSTFGVIEIGSIYWGPLVSRKPAATEAQFLFSTYVFDVLGYRRYEWKCHNRDTAWFSIIDKEWPALRKAYEAWLDPSNFDATGEQKRRLEDFRKDFGAT